MNLSTDYHDIQEDGRIILLYSGGTDSTLILHELIKRFPNLLIHTVSLDAPFLHKIKYESELKTRRIFIKYLLEQKYHIRHQEISIRHNLIPEMEHYYDDIRVFNVEPGGCPQAVYWLSTLLIYLKSGDHLYYGLLGIDDNTWCVPYYIERMKYFLETLGRKDISLHVPLLYKSKDYVIQKLFEYGIYEHTWHCETPYEENIPCLECKPCMDHLKALAGIAEFHDDIEIQKKARVLVDEAKSIIAKRSDERKERLDQILRK